MFDLQYSLKYFLRCVSRKKLQFFLMMSFLSGIETITAAKSDVILFENYGELLFFILPGNNRTHNTLR